MANVSNGKLPFRLKSPETIKELNNGIRFCRQIKPPIVTKLLIMANVSNGKHPCRQKASGVMTNLNNGKCLKWQVFLEAKVSFDKTRQVSQMAIISLA